MLCGLLDAYTWEKMNACMRASNDVVRKDISRLFEVNFCFCFTTSKMFFFRELLASKLKYSLKLSTSSTPPQTNSPLSHSLSNYLFNQSFTNSTILSAEQPFTLPTEHQPSNDHPTNNHLPTKTPSTTTPPTTTLTTTTTPTTSLTTTSPTKHPSYQPPHQFFSNHILPYASAHEITMATFHALVLLSSPSLWSPDLVTSCLRVLFATVDEDECLKVCCCFFCFVFVVVFFVSS